ncbi:hypothetical protein DV517_07480 [Streptomyces sp. S816]|nr:hypothetical protein DV517_07480 [Streptomyces sp. S816]
MVMTILRRFGPVLRPGGRLLVVTSGPGTLGRLDPRLHHLFDGASLDQVESAVDSWRAAVHTRTAEVASAVLDVVLDEHVDPCLYGELIRFGEPLDRHGVVPPVEQDRPLTP